MALGIRLAGRTAKRGIIQRIPGGADVAREVESWLRADYADAVQAIRLGPAATGDTSLQVVLHPSGGTVELTFEESGRVTATADTEAAGPGYHTFLWRLLGRLGVDLSIAWSTGDVPPAEIPDGQELPPPDRAAIEREHLIALRMALGRVRAGHRDGAPPQPLHLPNGTRFSSAGVLASPLGPRDAAWLEAAIGVPSVAIDVIPWWADATSARYFLNRALCLMWTEVRWRRPATDDERAIADDVLRLLRRAHPLDPALPFPWREWAELIDLRNASDPLRDLVNEQAAAVSDASPRIGYRRHPVLVVHEGWGLEVPGSFAERRTAEEWFGREAGREITIAAVTTGHGATALRPEAFLDQVAGEFGTSVLRHADGGVVGRARLDADASSGLSTYVLEGFSAVVGSGAAIRVEFDDPEDWSWAVDRWRALRPA